MKKDYQILEQYSVKDSKLALTLHNTVTKESDDYLIFRDSKDDWYELSAWYFDRDKNDFVKEFAFRTSHEVEDKEEVIKYLFEILANRLNARAMYW